MAPESSKAQEAMAMRADLNRNMVGKRTMDMDMSSSDEESNNHQRLHIKPHAEHMEREARIRVLEKSSPAIEIELSDTDSRD